jgi:small GTP-binding protein
MPHVEIPQAEIKVVILGDSHIGKTSLVTRFVEGYYRDNSRSATLGANFANRSIPSSSGVMTKVQIWDTAGVESGQGPVLRGMYMNYS